MTTNPAPIEATEGDWTARYHGGAYIDIFHAEWPSYALDCINVWDYVTDTPTIPFTAEAVHGKLLGWIADGCAAEAALHQLPFLTPEVTK